LSKKPKLVEINGIDEAGRIGERIYIVRLGVPLPSESSILLLNLKHFGNIVVEHSDLIGKDDRSLLSYAREVLDIPNISHTILALREGLQLKLLRQLMRLQSDSYFLYRKNLLNVIKRTPYDEAELSRLISDLSVFKNEPAYAESFTKAFAIRSMVMKLGTQSSLLRDSREGIDKLLVIQVDGGFPFVFWWKDDLDNGRIPKLARGACNFAGITSRDKCYPIVSASGAVASILRKFPQHTHFFPIDEIDEDVELPNEDYYQGHMISFTRPTFRHRMLIIGEVGSRLRSLIPYALHRSDRSRTWEPFHIQKSVPNFFHDYGEGGPDNTIGVYGTLGGTADKDDVKFLRENDYPCYHVSELQKSIVSLFDDLASEIDLYPSNARPSLQVKLSKLKETSASESK
jgi:hypothetical protein